MSLHTSMTVADVLAHDPRTAEVFLKHGMACVGCAIGPIETLAEVATIYQVPIEQLLAERTARCLTVPQAAGGPR